MRSHIGTVLSLVALLLLQACSSPEDTNKAEAAVVQFHALLDAGETRAIYSNASADLKKVSAEPEFVALLDAIHRKLGSSKTSERTGLMVNRGTSGTFLTLTQKTKYTEGDAVETFTYRISDDGATLAGYHVSSNALITK